MIARSGIYAAVCLGASLWQTSLLPAAEDQQAPGFGQQASWQQPATEAVRERTAAWATEHHPAADVQQQVDRPVGRCETRRVRRRSIEPRGGDVWPR